MSEAKKVHFRFETEDGSHPPTEITTEDMSTDKQEEPPEPTIEEELEFYRKENALLRHQCDEAVAEMERASNELLEMKRKHDEAKRVWKKLSQYVVTQPFGCHGYKCREPLCWSCFGEEEAEGEAKAASAAYKEMDAVLKEAQP